MNRAAAEERGQVYVPPLMNWKQISAERREKMERDKKAREEAEANVVKKGDSSAPAVPPCAACDLATLPLSCVLLCLCARQIKTRSRRF